MYRRLLSHSLAGLGLALSVSACSAPDLSQPCPIPPDVTPADPAYVDALNKCFPAMSEQAVDTRLKKDVDILFLIDNSTSMSPKQEVLATAIGNFITQIDATGANYHVGVVTTDIGTLPPPGNMFPGSNDPRCGTFKGDDGLLQNLNCRSRTTNASAQFTTACTNLCPATAMLPSQRWIAKDNGVYNVPGNSAAAAIDAFKCMGLVGDSGCGVESPLEAVKRALDGHLMENSGFLRDGSVLAVIFITDEDDCSVQMTQRTNLNPSAMDCSAQMSADPNYSCYNLDYRCIAKDIQCDQPLNTLGPKTGCKERTTTFLEPIEKYSRFFSALRPADKLVFGGIWSPSILDFNAGITTMYGNGQLQVGLEQGTVANTTLMNRAQRTQAACFNSTINTGDMKGFFGQAQLRLSTFKSKFDPSIWSEQSICDAAAYPNILNKIADKITKAVGVDCLGVLPNTDSAGNPACLVGFVDANQASSLPDQYLPSCSATCCNAWASSAQPVGPYGTGTPPAITKDPAIVAACNPEPNDCYCAVPSKAGLCPTTAIAGVWRQGDKLPDAGKVVNFRCAGTRPANPPSM